MRYQVKVVKRRDGYEWELQRAIGVADTWRNEVIADPDPEWEAVGWDTGARTEELAIQDATKLKNSLEADRIAEENAKYVPLD